MSDIVERLIEKVKLQKRLTDNNEYMDWLYEFTKKYECFTTTQWEYEKEDVLSCEDQEKVNMLSDFYFALEKYHSDNLIKPCLEPYTAWYNIAYKEVYFEIGIVCGQGSYGFACRRQEKPVYFTNFEDIVNKKVDSKLENKKAKLEGLRKFISECITLEIPIENIIQTVEEITKKHKE